MPPTSTSTRTATTATTTRNFYALLLREDAFTRTHVLLLATTCLLIHITIHAITAATSFPCAFYYEEACYLLAHPTRRHDAPFNSTPSGLIATGTPPTTVSPRVRRGLSGCRDACACRRRRRRRRLLPGCAFGVAVRIATASPSHALQVLIPASTCSAQCVLRCNGAASPPARTVVAGTPQLRGHVRFAAANWVRRARCPVGSCPRSIPTLWLHVALRRRKRVFSMRLN